MMNLEPRFPVAVIGVGNMGAGMAHRLLALGWPVRVVDLDEAKVQGLVSFGALAGINQAQEAIDSVVTIVCVVNAEQTEAVLFGPLR
jgi:3-hydroxyisobutyrate dehydrogenase-like beta-hydroxyacid dehydrogenase